MPQLLIELPEPLFAELMEQAGRCHDLGYTPAMYATEAVERVVIERRAQRPLRLSVEDAWARQRILDSDE